ncbi:unnamed protein product [Leuciscus chuanchicus]
MPDVGQKAVIMDQITQIPAGSTKRKGQERDGSCGERLRCGPNCCASEKEVFSVHHGNSAYIQVSNNGIYANFSHCMANSRLGCKQRKSFVSSEEQ